MEGKQGALLPYGRRAECPGTTKERKGKLSREKTRILTTY